MATAAPNTVDALLKASPALWRGAAMPCMEPATISTGFEALDSALPAGGWPVAGIVEILHAQHGLGELSLLLPALAACSQCGPVAIIAPPQPLYAPALAQVGVALESLLWLATSNDKDTAWALETALRSQACQLVIAWPGRLRPEAVRRLQVAATEGRTLGVLMRPDGRSAPTVHLRLRLDCDANGQTWVSVEKARGSHARPRVQIPWPVSC